MSDSTCNCCQCQYSTPPWWVTMGFIPPYGFQGPGTSVSPRPPSTGGGGTTGGGTGTGGGTTGGGSSGGGTNPLGALCGLVSGLGGLLGGLL